MPNTGAPIEAVYDVVILSDLLHFDKSHDALLMSVTSLLRRSSDARTYIAAGKYTPAHVCENFVRSAESVGIILSEQPVDEGWRGSLEVRGSGLNKENLAIRKDMCRWWTGRWAAVS